MSQSTTDPKRIVFLDWLRGLAALIMLQGHTFHSFIQPALREHGVYMYSQFFGGQAAAVFLFVTGITYGLGMGKREGLPAWQRVLAALKRARYLFIIAILFRVQLWLFGLPQTFLKDLLIVDVLNLMAFSAAALSLIALAETARARSKAALLAGIVLAALAPVMSDLNTAAIPAYLRDYFVPNATGFSIFPWGSFIAFGLAFGNALPLIERGSWARVMQWSALCGLTLIAAGLYFEQLPFSIYPHAEFWLNSPALIACKMGALCLMASAAFLWTEHLSPGWSWIRLLGTTSLPVYWVHVELVYGRWFWFWKEQLTVGACLVFAVLLVVAMVGMSAAIRKLRAESAEWRSHSRDYVVRGTNPRPHGRGLADERALAD